MIGQIVEGFCSRGKALDSRKWKNATRSHPRMLPTGSAKTALLPAILGDVNAGGGGAPIERENEGEMDHFVTIEKKKGKKKRHRKRKIRTSRKLKYRGR